EAGQRFEARDLERVEATDGLEDGLDIAVAMDEARAGFGGDDEATCKTTVVEGAEEMRGAAIEQRGANVDGITGAAGTERCCDADAREAVELGQQGFERPCAIE